MRTDSAKPFTEPITWLTRAEEYLDNNGGGEFRQSQTTVSETIVKAITP